MTDEEIPPGTSQQEPQMLAMHKSIAKTSDGTRELIFYTFTEASSTHDA